MMMMMMWVCWHSSYIPSYALGRGTRWYQETNLCLRSKVSSTWALTDLSISPPWRRDRQVILGKASSTGPLQTTRNKPLPARQIIFNHNRTFVLAFQPPSPLPVFPLILTPPGSAPTSYHHQWLHMNLIWPSSHLTHLTATERTRDPPQSLLVFLRDGNQTHLGLLTSVPVSESQPMFVLIPASSPGPGSQSFDPVNIEF
jgi:hypothetical protein